jgi:hypothetical protein
MQAHVFYTHIEWRAMSWKRNENGTNQSVSEHSNNKHAVANDTLHRFTWDTFGPFPQSETYAGSVCSSPLGDANPHGCECPFGLRL